MYELARRFPGETRFFFDSGNSFAWSTHYFQPARRGTYRVGMGYSAMAWAIGAAVGTAMARREPFPVVCVTGDGSMLMAGQELTVAVAECLPLVFVVLDDSALGMVRHGQRLGGAELICHRLPPVDFCAIANAMGADAYRIERSEDLDEIDFAAVCARKGPTLLDVHIDPEQVPPMQLRITTLHPSDQLA
jgi:acetolactate synthase-1/2/3 large subunit